MQKHFRTYSSYAGCILGVRFNKDVPELASIDAHSFDMASSIHYDLSEYVNCPLINNSIWGILDP